MTTRRTHCSHNAGSWFACRPRPPAALAAAARLGLLALLASLALLPCGAAAGTLVQSDWSLGSGQTGPVTDPGGRFESASQIAWLSVPGQLSLSSTALATCPEHLISDAYYYAFGLDAADVDGDGDTDVVGASELSGVVSLWLNSGTLPVSWTEQVVDGDCGGADGIELVDIDADGRLDIVCSASDPTDEIAWYRNGGGLPIVWERQVIDPAWTSCYEVSTADVDGDGRRDVLGASWNDGLVAWWRNGGERPIVWTRQIVATGLPGAHSAWGADYDGDGDTDIAGTTSGADQVLWWRNDGGDPIAWTPIVIREAFDGGRSVHPADLDADGDIDLVGAAWTREVTWWRNDEGDSLHWTEQVIDPNFAGGHHVRVADIDGDGHLDVLAVACTAGDVIWYGNDGGSPITWTRHVVDANVPAAIEARCGDIDGDGALDIVASSYTMGTFSWWEVSDFRPEGELTGSILDLQEQPALIGIDWTAEVPPGTALRFQTRSGDDPDALGAWSQELTAPGPLAPPLGRYVQYRVLMESTVPARSPVLTAVAFSWATSSAAPGPERLPFSSCRVASPARGRATVCFTLTEACSVELQVFDSAGRVVAGVPQLREEPGQHEVGTPPLPAGVYFARLTAGATTADLRFVLIE